MALSVNTCVAVTSQSVLPPFFVKKTNSQLKENFFFSLVLLRTLKRKKDKSM